MSHSWLKYDISLGVCHLSWKHLFYSDCSFISNRYVSINVQFYTFVFICALSTHVYYTHVYILCIFIITYVIYAYTCIIQWQNTFINQQQLKCLKHSNICTDLGSSKINWKIFILINKFMKKFFKTSRHSLETRLKCSDVNTLGTTSLTDSCNNGTKSRTPKLPCRPTVWEVTVFLHVFRNNNHKTQFNV